MFDKSIVWHHEYNDESYTAEYIKAWCKHHMRDENSKYSYIAQEFYYEYWSDGCDPKFAPNPKVYYIAEMGKRYDGKPLYKLTRDIDKSPRKL